MKDTNKLEKELNKYFETLEKERDEITQKYPLDVPNTASNKAIITGIFIENSFEPHKGDFLEFFELEKEKVFVWTHETNKNSVLVVQANEGVKNDKCWITVASLLELSRYLCTSFEQSLVDHNFSYRWMYYFDSKSSIQNTTFYGMTVGGPTLFESTVFDTGIVLKATDIAEMAHIIELLYRDEKAYTASAALQLSFSLHYCCLICETGDFYYHDHLSQEPEIWEHISAIPEMEAAIVQSCRSVEAILGEPPNQKNQRKVYEFKEKWKSLLGFSADIIFEKAGISFFDFYYKLFHEYRNSSAHSYGNIHYSLLRRNTVESQCYAAKILFDYIKNHVIDNDVALQKLSFNKKLLSRVSSEMSTSLTKK